MYTQTHVCMCKHMYLSACVCAHIGTQTRSPRPALPAHPAPDSHSVFLLGLARGLASFPPHLPNKQLHSNPQ